MNQRRRKSQRGVTLIEMMVVVIIIGLFAALVGPQLFKNVGKSKRTAAHAQIENFMTALVSYNGDVGAFPTTEMGLQVLRVKPENVNNWSGPYLMKDIPQDPIWPGSGKDYRYISVDGMQYGLLFYLETGRIDASCIAGVGFAGNGWWGEQPECPF